MNEEIPGYEELAGRRRRRDRRARGPERCSSSGRARARRRCASSRSTRRPLDGDRLRAEAMLDRARERLPDADLRASRLEDPLPEGPFDLVVSVLAVHHLDGDGKRDLFTRVAQLSRHLRPRRRRRPGAPRGRGDRDRRRLRRALEQHRGATHDGCDGAGFDDGRSTLRPRGSRRLTLDAGGADDEVRREAERRFRRARATSRASCARTCG